MREEQLASFYKIYQEYFDHAGYASFWIKQADVYKDRWSFCSFTSSHTLLLMPFIFPTLLSLSFISFFFYSLCLQMFLSPLYLLSDPIFCKWFAKNLFLTFIRQTPNYRGLVIYQFWLSPPPCTHILSVINLSKRRQNTQIKKVKD